MNYVLLAGRLTRDPEIRGFASGRSVAKLRLAINERLQDEQGQKIERTVYVDVEAWTPLAEECGRTLRRGAPVLVEGRLRLDQWKTKEGQNRQRLLVRALRVEAMESDRRAGADEPAEALAPDAAPEDAAN